MNESERIRQPDVRHSKVFRFTREGMHARKVAKKKKKEHYRRSRGHE